MTVFRVWAPDPSSVVVAIDDGSEPSALPLARSDDGWWSGRVDRAGPGTRYRFVLDGGPGRPDPRSPWQPEGIDGPSAVVDQRQFSWTDYQWQGAVLANATIYELHIGTFSPEGTFDGAVTKLDELVDLGITAIEIMPVAESSGDRGWGYDGVLLYAPHHAYGGPDGLKRLVDACHDRGLAVVLDVVYNHLGPAGNYLAEYGPYFTDRYQTPWGQAVNMDGPGSDEVRRFFIDNALMWLRDYHLDGLRLDAVHAIVDESAFHFLEQLAAEVDELSHHLGRTLWLIAESDRNDPRLVRSREAGGYGLDASWSDDFHHALHALLTGEHAGYYADFGTIAQVAKAIRDVYVYDGGYSAFRGRRHGRPVGELPATRFLGYLQDHDQIGNRALGERSGALMSVGRLKIGAALVLCGPFVPMLFQGEEWAADTPFLYFTDHRDPELGRAVSEGRRSEFAPFGWTADQVPDPQDVGTWRRSVLDWAERDKGYHIDVLAWHRDLLTLRRREPELTNGNRRAIAVAYDEEQRWLTVWRGNMVMACSLADRPQTLDLGRAGQSSDAGLELLLASWPEVGSQGTKVSVPGESVVIGRLGQR